MDDKYYKKYIQIGLNILHYRKEQGLTQLQLAEMTGYSRNQIQRVETAAAAPSIAILYDISEALNVPIEKLLEIR
ncbi:helix-turn-helix transcriptional regulator [Oscillibacter sp.]|jgi:transcriptional regulator with XRE-family HTH domain|uniref:helix-turn-helix domain-containing protein n=1 Tax=Oscillibacter sp. TaxID=1945593 RepID=UPI00289963D9|nr:helix-turn-helix transcriptional regulator [Oscillibacter sp.]